MHINLELLECVYLVSAMLLEIPYMAAHEFDARRRMISKQFHHQLRVGERQPLLGNRQPLSWGLKTPPDQEICCHGFLVYNLPLFFRCCPCVRVSSLIEMQKYLMQ